jgi:hypothetical protein
MTDKNIIIICATLIICSIILSIGDINCAVNNWGDDLGHGLCLNYSGAPQ